MDTLWRIGGRGGLVTALSSADRLKNVSWVTSAEASGLSAVKRRAGGGQPQRSSPWLVDTHRYVSTSQRAYEAFRNVACNWLWFLQHQMWGDLAGDRVVGGIAGSWKDGYVPVNRAFAQATVREVERAGPSTLVMVQDFHLYLVPGMVRRRVPGCVIEHFVHIPWPPPEVWQPLPDGIRLAILESLLCPDLVGLQTRRDVDSFLECCKALLPGARVDRRNGTVAYRGRLARVRAYPASVDVAELERKAASPEVSGYLRDLLPLCGNRTLVRVDRVEPTKNILRGFRAFSMLLERRPELRGEIRFLAFLVPPQEEIPEYEEVRRGIDVEVQSVNNRFGTGDWAPISVFYQHDYLLAIAALKVYDALLVNPLMDGMNLVAKEGPVVNSRDGVLVLSETAGAYEQLRSGAVPVVPGDVEGPADALYRALTMPLGERRGRMQALRSAIAREDASHWLYRQLEDLAAVA